MRALEPDQPVIYVVDDQEPNRRLLERILARGALANVQSFADGASALEAIEAVQPDVILLDLHMPGTDGFAVLERLARVLPPHAFVPVLVLTGDVERDARTRALSGGATDFLSKPFDAEEVLLRVRNLLRTRELHKALMARNAELSDDIVERTRALTELEGEWTAVAESLARLGARETAEATADALCRELAFIPDLDAVAIVAFGANGASVPLALIAPVEIGVAVNVPLPMERSAVLHARALGGPWVDTWPEGDGEGDPAYFARIRGAGLVAAAYLPMATDTGPVGLLVAASIAPDAARRLTRRIPALEAFAAVGTALLGPGIAERQHGEAILAVVADVIDRQAFTPVFQPIVDLADGSVQGYEALTRFTDGTRPDRRFADATAVGLGLDLELATLEAAVSASRDLAPGTFVSLNVSPDLILEVDRVKSVLAGVEMPVVIEITEHVPVADYPALRRSLDALGPDVRFAIDDAGAGYSSFRHIVELRPDFVKLDIGLVRDIERDPARQAFVAGMVYFALRTNCTLIAEGIETEDERTALASLAVDLGQGYLLGRPGPARRDLDR
ncbi:MAG TPA: EAL domain-containing response regulator [Candidatus Limnocylindrales bacterium]|nr:EAL domain-containing response regulator [Candidatus Limnocylindrales bacterium]